VSLKRVTSDPAVIMRVFVMLLTVLSVAVAACVALPYVDREEELELSQVSDTLVTLNYFSNGTCKVTLLKLPSDIAFAVYYPWERCLYI
jgi:hypothetical protein